MPYWARALIGHANRLKPYPGFTEEDMMTVWERCEGRCAVSGLEITELLVGTGRAKKAARPEPRPHPQSKNVRTRQLRPLAALPGRLKCCMWVYGHRDLGNVGLKEWRDMTRATHELLVSSVAAIALLLGGATAVQGQSIPLDEAEILAELNDTDGDLGFHALVDAEAWDRLSIRDPDGREILAVRPDRSLAQQGLTELFFESAEPEFDELSPEEFFEHFPEGLYTITGRSIEGDTLEGTAKFRHRMPAPVSNVAVSGIALAEDLDCDEETPVVGEPVVISWDRVTRSHPEIGNPTDARIRIDRYQVVVEREEPTLLIYSVDLPGDLDAYEVTVPPEFIALGDEFKYEILTRAKNGNQTALESCFALN